MRHFANHLRPFEAQLYLRVALLPVAEIEFEEWDDMKREYGFGPASKQSRFFDPPHRDDRIVGLLYVPGQGVPTSLTHPSVICRLFGTIERDGSLELWHISTSPSHTYNDNQHGTRWGVHNLIRDDSGSKVRWKTLNGKNITRTTARAHVRGSPNPYAVECLVRVVERLGCPAVRQHDQMPCAKLFHTGYDHRSDPAIMLIYETLRFERPIEQYSWNREQMPSLSHSYAQMAQKMMFGLSVV